MMVPIFAIVSWLSIVFYKQSVYFQIITDSYAAVALASYFALMLSYISTDLHNQKDYFRGIRPKPWPNSISFPAKWLRKACAEERGCLRTPRSGLTWLNVSHLSPISSLTLI